MQAQITTPVARLTETESGHVVHGVALGEGDKTRGAHGLKRWPREALEPAAASLAGKPVTHNRANPKGHGGDVVGQITKTAYEPNIGVVYEARLTDSDVAQKLSLGQFEVSIEASNPERVEHDDEGAAILHGFEFDGMAVVENGASPSNHASAGSAADNAAIAALSADDIAAKLASYSVEYSGTASGKLDESEIPSDDFASHYLIPGDTKSDSSFPVVDASGNLRRGNVAAAWDLRGHAPDESAMREALLDLNGAFDDPPIETDDEQAENAAPVGDDSQDGGNGASLAGETDADNDSESTMTEDNGEQYEKLAAKLSERDDRVEELREQVEALDEENAELASRVSELEDAEEEIEEVKGVYAAELANGSFTEDDLVEKFTVAELREKYEEDDDADLVNDDPEPDVQSGGGDGDTVASLSADEREEKKLLETRIETFESRGWDSAAQTNREKLAELTGDTSILEGDS